MSGHSETCGQKVGVLCTASWRAASFHDVRHQEISLVKKGTEGCGL